MKRRIVCMILVLAFALSMLSGCILPTNTERDLKQVIATVNYKGMVAQVTKLEAVESYYNYAQTYMQNYGMTERQAFDYVIEQLTNRKVLVLDAIDRNVGGLNIRWDSANRQVAVDSLPAVILNEAQDKINEQMESVYKQYVEIVNDEYDEDEEGETEQEPEEEEDPRTVRPLPIIDEEEEEKDYTVTVTSWYKNFDYATQWEEYECLDKNVARIAFNRLKKLFADQYKTEETFLQAQYEQLIIEQLQEDLFDGVTVTDAEVMERYKANLKKNEDTFNADESAYASAFSANEVLYYHPETGYATVKHVLLAFEEAGQADRKVENTHIKFGGDYTMAQFEEMRSSGNYSDSVIAAYRAKLAETILVNNYGDFADWWKDGEGYDEEEMKDLIDWRDLVYDKDNVATYSALDFFDVIREDVNSQADVKAKLAKFADYIYGYSNPSDSGMFNNTFDYTVEPDESKYMEEFTNICLYLVSGKELPENDANYGVYGDAIGEVGSMAWCVTDYGVHLVMISYIADANTDEDGYYIANTANDLKNIEIGDTDHTTLYDYIHDTLKGAKETSVIANYQQQLVENKAKGAVTVNTDVVNAFFK